MKLFFDYLNTNKLQVALERLAVVLYIGKFPGAVLDPDTTILTQSLGGLPQTHQVKAEIIP